MKKYGREIGPGDTASFTMLLVPPLPGERRKGNSLVMASRKYRSKWWTAVCMGGAKKCIAGECRHVEAICHTYKNFHAESRDRAERAA